ncbi:MAG: hypothetical protein Q8P84_08465 [Deltaproteobacteria bacterium]|nr:hypothetical protein [Deltaproteobacteria bacterium]
MSATNGRVVIPAKAGIQVFILATFVLLFVSCAKQSYSPPETEAHKEYEQGDFEDALAALEKQPFRNKDRLLYLLDKATFLHAAGRYEESNAVFEEAFHTAEYWESKSAGQEIAAAFTNETLLPYSGEIYERLLIQVYQMLNFALLGKTDEALIEVRQYHNDLRRFFGSQVPKVYQDPFAFKFAAILWELKGQKDDARIDNQKALKTNTKSGLVPDEGNVIVILETGLSPILEGEKTVVADIVIKLPKIKERESETAPIQIIIDKEESFEPIPLNSITAMAEANLEKKLEIAKTHKFFKTALKEWSETKILYNKDWPWAQKIFAAAAIALVANSLEAADLRIWSTLPNHFQITRFSLAPGKHTLKIKGSRKTISKKIVVPEKGPLFLAFRVFRGTL